jgi:23S rRNA (uracil1939-C5)-methyltransferase
MRYKPKPIIAGVTIFGIADKGRAIGRTPEGVVVFVEGAVPGDIVTIQTTKKKKGMAEGYVLEVTSPSPDRVKPFCTHFGVCGGCKWQNLDYDAQLFHKDKVVKDAFKHLAKVEVGEWLPIVGAQENRYYRNKLEFGFSDRRWRTAEEMLAGTGGEPGLGFHRPGAFDKVVHVNECFLQADPGDPMRQFVYDESTRLGASFYNVHKQEGFMRNVMIRVSSLGQVMMIVSVGYEDEPLRVALLDAIVAKFPELTTLMYCINPKVNDVIVDLDIIVYNGPGYIEDRLGKVLFRIGPKSFFQTNTRQATRLYDIALSFAGLTGQELVYDLYTGIGSIALYLSQQAAEIVGIEEIAPAIEDAKINAALNGISNCTFYAGDVRKLLTQDLIARHGRPDVLITDPPRVGMHPDVVQTLLELAPKRLVYVSCNPATQARDVQLLSSKYAVIKVQPVDMFPHTHHIENVALLELI